MFRRRIKLHPVEKLREFFWPRSGWLRVLQYSWKRIWRLSDTPHAIALGMAAGAYASFTPFVGFHFVIAFLLAWILRGNLIASAFGTFVGNPFTFPFIWFGTYDLGIWLLGGTAENVVDPGGLSMDLFFGNTSGSILPIVTPMLVGSVLLGVPVAVMIYYASRGAVGTYQARRRSVLGGNTKIPPAAIGKRHDAAE